MWPVLSPPLVYHKRPQLKDFNLNPKKMLPVSVLCARRDSIYKKYPVDVWDEYRNMMNYNGKNVVIGHPPCRLFSRLRVFSKAHPGEKELAYRCVQLVKQYGGIIEHPAQSTLWRELSLNLSGVPDSFGAFTLSVDQLWWGHSAQKRTWLYIVGISPGQLPDYSPRFIPASKVVSTSTSRNPLPEMSKADRERTPNDFAKWLIDMAVLISKNR